MNAQRQGYKTAGALAPQGALREPDFEVRLRDKQPFNIFVNAIKVAFGLATSWS